MRTVLREILADKIPDKYFVPSAYPENIRWHTADALDQLLCDCMATAMYRCLDYLPREKQGLARTRLAEYGFNCEEIEKSLSKLENEGKCL